MIDDIFRREAGRVLATLIRLLGDFDAAEEARQDTFAAALEQWPVQGIPKNPAAWLTSTARNKAVDRVRRETVFRSKIVEQEAACMTPVSDPIDKSDEVSFGDDRLRLIFTCCHPALNLESQIALTLRAVCGMST